MTRVIVIVVPSAYTLPALAGVMVAVGVGGLSIIAVNISVYTTFGSVGFVDTATTVRLMAS